MTFHRQLLGLGALVVAFGVTPIASAAPPDRVAAALHVEVQKIGPAAFTASDYKPGVVRHIVLLRFRDHLDPAKRQSVIDQFLGLQQAAVRDGKHYIVSIETGPQISGEGASHGLEQAFILTFASQGDRNYFIGTPVVNDPRYYEAAHEQFKKRLKPVLAENGLVSFDFPVVAKTP